MVANSNPIVEDNTVLMLCCEAIISACRESPTMGVSRSMLQLTLGTIPGMTSSVLMGILLGLEKSNKLVRHGEQYFLAPEVQA